MVKFTTFQKRFNKVVSKTGLVDKMNCGANVANFHLLAMRRRFNSENKEGIKEAFEEQKELRRKRYLRERSERAKECDWFQLLKDRCPKCKKKLHVGDENDYTGKMYCKDLKCRIGIHFDKYETLKLDLIKQLNEK